MARSNQARRRVLVWHNKQAGRTFRMCQPNFFPALRRSEAASLPPFRQRLDYFDFLEARTFAQRALAATEIFLRAAALIFRRLRTIFLPGDDEVFAAKASSCDWRRSMCAFNTAMRFNLAPEKLRISFIRTENKFRRAEIKAINFTVVKQPRRLGEFQSF